MAFYGLVTELFHDILHGACPEALKEVPDEIIDAVVTDPPYGLGFMGKEWDKPGSMFEKKAARENEWDHVGGNHNPVDAQDRARTYLSEGRKFQAWCDGWLRECYRVLKPGGHILAFGGTRVYHRLTCAIEDAGFEIRDCLMWLYGSGFPKSLDISKAIDKAAGAEREVIGQKKAGQSSLQRVARVEQGYRENLTACTPENIPITTPSTDLAKKWSGWGTALKPAWEPIILAMKPTDGTFAENAAKHGVAGLNVDGCRVGTGAESEGVRRAESTAEKRYAEDGRDFALKPGPRGGSPNGRFPANLILDEEAGKLLDEQTGVLTSGKMKAGTKRKNTLGYKGNMPDTTRADTIGDTGGASRFFYCAKANSGDRFFLCKTCDLVEGQKDADAHKDHERVAHPTVKPLELMRYLVRLVTPQGGVVLDPFSGTGTTIVAAKAEGVSGVGVEMDEAYARVGRARLEL